MAKQLKSFSFPTSSNYSWDEWLNGEPWLLTPGTDFSTNVTDFRTSLYQAAAKRGLKTKTRTTPEGLVIQAFPKDE